MLLLASGLLMTTQLWAATPLNPTEVLQFSIAKDGLTRISIENDSIDGIYVYPMEYEDNIKHHPSGHVFVVAEDMNSSLYVTLLTKRGLAQDLKLTPAKKKAEPILLKFEDEKLHQKELLDQTSSLLEKFIQGLIPGGFYRIEIEEASRSRGSLSCVVETAYQKAPYRVLVYTVKNETGEKVTLDNRLLWEEGDLALAFDKSQIEANQTAKMYVIQKI